ncbi:hypothetical protein JIN84_22730 [Luteolibacter yonseiensis]|uniref:Lipoprotein n=1 Tax=Luteolibacter yonseiensis TaxID=1144680 RepID=A0A934V9L0_9BACT|nr:hypothetical protein [Luteolibacter yonseiensis]MBK1818452.1 hypothetical protein [Luteolibacter yonseiensis]
MKIIPTASLAVISLFLGACDQGERQAAWWGAEKERVELAQQVELAKYRFDRLLGSEFEDLEKIRAATEKTATLRRSLESKKVLAAAEVESLQEQWAVFRNDMIHGQRQRAIGKSFDKMVLASGRSFENVSVSAITDSGVTIRHSDGSARLRFQDLDVRQRWLFGLEEDLAIAAHQKEVQNAAEYEKWVDARLASNMEKKKQEADAALEVELAASRARTNLLASQTASADTGPFSRSSSVGDSTYYRSSRTYRSYSRPTYYRSYNYCAPVVSRCYYPSRGTIRVGAGRAARESSTLSGRPYNSYVP